MRPIVSSRTLPRGELKKRKISLKAAIPEEFISGPLSEDADDWSVIDSGSSSTSPMMSPRTQLEATAAESKGDETKLMALPSVHPTPELEAVEAPLNPDAASAEDTHDEEYMRASDLHEGDFDVLKASPDISHAHLSFSGVNVAWLFADCSLLRDFFDSAFVHCGITPRCYLLQGDTRHSLLGAAGFV